MDSFGRIIEWILVVSFLFLLPIYYMALKQDAINQIYVTTETSYFIDSIRNCGYFTKQMYDTYEKKLMATNESYQITLVHYKYTVLEEESNQYRGEYEYIPIERLEKEEKYYFQRGDYIKAEVKNQSKTLSSRISQLLFKTEIGTNQIQVIYGGAIRDEME